MRRQNSLACKLLLVVLALSAGVTLVASVVTFHLLSESLTQEKLSYLEQYAAERARAENDL